MAHRIVIGCMTGTSLDGIDAAMVRIDGAGLAMSARVMRTLSASLGRVATPLRKLANGQPCTAAEICRAAADLSELHADAIQRLCRRRRADLIAVHGQTVHHAPPLSWQLINPAIIAHRLRTPVVSDLRAADLAAGGQGAPITPIADFVLFRDRRERRGIVNLGGFCNVTMLPASRPAARPAQLRRLVARIRGGDVCVCNQLLDAVSRRFFGSPFDPEGRGAAAGQVHPAARRDLLRRLHRQARAGRSLGTGDELFDWLNRHARSATGGDLARTACEAIAEVIAGALERVDRVILAGGGARNAVLVEALRGRVGAPVALCDEFGVPAACREAAAMAILGTLSADGIPITLPAITGSRRPPPAGAWVLPAGLSARSAARE